MLIGQRIRTIREAKRLSQGEIEHRCGLLRSYISRVENGHTVPSVETLERLARALEVPLYQVFYDGEELPRPPHPLPGEKKSSEKLWGSTGREARELRRLCRLLARMTERRRRLLLSLAQRMAQRAARVPA